MGIADEWVAKLAPIAAQTNVILIIPQFALRIAANIM